MNTQKNMEERFAKEMEARSVYYEPKGSPWGEVQTYRYQATCKYCPAE